MTQSTKVLDYVPQPDALTCQAAAIARVVGTLDVNGIRRDLTRYGRSAGDPANMGDYMKPRVKEYKYNGNASLNDAIAALKDGYHLITHGWFTGSGHVIGLSAWDEKSKTFNAEDPWFEFCFPRWQYLYDVDGDDIPYSALGIYAACVVGQSVNDAIYVYNNLKVNFDDKGMWLHMVKN